MCSQSAWLGGTVPTTAFCNQPAWWRAFGCSPDSGIQNVHSLATNKLGSVCSSRHYSSTCSVYYLSRFTFGTLYERENSNIKSVALANTELLVENLHFIFRTSNILDCCLKPLIISCLIQFTYYCYKRESGET